MATWETKIKWLENGKIYISSGNRDNSYFGKFWVAKILGVDKKFGFERSFVNDKDGAVLKDEGIYEVHRSNTWSKKPDAYFIEVKFVENKYEYDILSKEEVLGKLSDYDKGGYQSSTPIIENNVLKEETNNDKDKQKAKAIAIAKAKAKALQLEAEARLRVEGQIQNVTLKGEEGQKYLLDNGFEKIGPLFNKYKKKFIFWKKNNIYYSVSVDRIGGEWIMSFKDSTSIYNSL